MPIYCRPACLADISEITAIYDNAVSTSTATFDWQPPGSAPHLARLQAADPLRPFDVITDGQRILGWASLGDASIRAGWRFTGEVVIYIHPEHQGRGYGKVLLQHLINAGETAGLHAFMARITDDNAASIALHQRCGFTVIGVLPEVGRKFDRWLNVVVLHRPVTIPK